VLAFRLTHRTWCLLTAAVPGINQLLAQLPISQLVQDDSRTARPPGKSLLNCGLIGFSDPCAMHTRLPQDLESRQLATTSTSVAWYQHCCAGLHPFPFHFLCVVMHAISSMLVLGLCQHLFAVLEDSTPLADSSSGTQQVILVQQDGVPSKGLLQQLLMWQQQPQWWRTPRSFKHNAQALLAGLMFALHPVHTEVSTGVFSAAAAWLILLRLRVALLSAVVSCGCS
jgi:hypothetical protein